MVFRGLATMYSESGRSKDILLNINSISLSLSLKERIAKVFEGEQH